MKIAPPHIVIPAEKPAPYSIRGRNPGSGGPALIASIRTPYVAPLCELRKGPRTRESIPAREGNQERLKPFVVPSGPKGWGNRGTRSACWGRAAGLTLAAMSSEPGSDGGDAPRGAPGPPPRSRRPGSLQRRPRPGPHLQLLGQSLVQAAVAGGHLLGGRRAHADRRQELPGLRADRVRRRAGDHHRGPGRPAPRTGPVRRRGSRQGGPPQAPAGVPGGHIGRDAVRGRVHHDEHGDLVPPAG